MAHIWTETWMRGDSVNMNSGQPGALATCSDRAEHPGVLGVSGESYLKRWTFGRTGTPHHHTV